MEKYLSGYNENSVHFFNLMMEGLKSYVDAESFWDAVDEDTIFKFHYHFPDFPKEMSKAQYKEWFSKYTAPESSAEFINVYKDLSTPGQTTLIMQYVVHYKQGVPDMNFLSIATVKDNKVVAWDDYLDTSK
ncbi:hypothetical protein [Pediococcus pentosaceus]|uniref:SnoaL-like domain-containing protein n=1 Tax=Pediococcus pentosaceus TaxID=1255 RepID=A0A6L5A381_PEDPE|nr:hypothetical protein [Pediococcus pentosaceus]KAF0413637.1 hypothetical protein GBO79_06690 [Pediococcus pentosaceus]KAF0503950.1 hypothetical protein GBP22_03590 [Pediococcus pentosaceus]MBF7127267.1 hypothetical protein [Pediococcus pentosaceus]